MSDLKHYPIGDLGKDAPVPCIRCGGQKDSILYQLCEACRLEDQLAKATALLDEYLAEDPDNPKVKEMFTDVLVLALQVDTCRLHFSPENDYSEAMHQVKYGVPL